jgi:hypothetical protein
MISAQVCTSWKRWAYDASLYRVLDFYPYRRRLDDAAAELLLSRVNHLRKLNLTYCLSIRYMDHFLELIASRYPDTLVRLNVSLWLRFRPLMAFLRRRRWT